MISERAGPAAGLVLVAVAAGSTGGMMLGRAGSDLLFYGCAVAQAAASLLAGRLAVRFGSRAVLVILIGGAVALRLWLLVQAPTLSGDIYRYVWDGRIVNAGFNPYQHVPADPALAGLRDPEQYGLIDKRDYAVTIYPPVAQALFATVTSLSTKIWAMKLAMVLLEGVAVLAVMRLLVRLGRPVGSIAVYLLHPAPLWEIAGNGHVDAAMMAFLFGAFAWGGAAAAPYRSALLMTLGALVKPTAGLGLPALWRPWQVRLPLAVLAVVMVCYLPFIGAGPGVIGFLPNYAHEQGLDTGQGFYWLALLRQLGLVRAGLTTLYVASSGALLLGVAVYTRARGDGLLAALEGTALLLVLFLLLLTPTFPWYGLAALPMTPLLGLWSPFAFLTGGFLLYSFHADAPTFLARWSIVVALTLLAAIWDLRRKTRRDPRP